MGTIECYKRLDPALQEEIAGFVIKKVREEEAKTVKARHDRKRANVKLALKKYREIAEHVDNAVYSAIHAEDDLTLQELLELMSGNGKGSFSVDSLRDSAAKSQMLVSHMNRMIEVYRETCEKSGKDEEMRRYRVLYYTFLSDEPKAADEIAEEEFIDKSTVYRDIEAACDKLAVLFFGVYGLKFL